jgi:hypothetical protein
MNLIARSAERRRWMIVALILLIAAFAIRVVQFGNPMIQVDENFYLLVGDRMWRGALPYVDIWDRKPIGLFLIYAAIRLLGGDGILQYQIVATLFAAGTAFVIARIAVRMAGITAATVAAILYILLIGLVGGSGGQAPVFYNLLVAGGGLLTLKAFETDDPVRIRRLGCLTVLLLGLALQIKYTVLFEGVFFGLALVWRSWRGSGRVGRPAVDALLWIGIALLPTALALAYYVARGHADAFIYANFLSIGERSSDPQSEVMKRLGHAWISIHLPMIAVLLAVVLEPWRAFARGTTTFGFAIAWLGAAIVGYLIFGSYFDHYVLPLFVPMAVVIAPLFTCRRKYIGVFAAGFLLLSGAIAYQLTAHGLQKKRGNRQVAEAVAKAIRPRLTNCLYVYDGDSIFYYLTNSCLPGRYPFPAHLNLQRESRAIGIDPVAEVRRIMAERPSVIVDHVPHDDDLNPAALAIVGAELNRSYRLAATFPLKSTAILVYERRKDR